MYVKYLNAGHWRRSRNMPVTILNGQRSQWSWMERKPLIPMISMIPSPGMSAWLQDRQTLSVVFQQPRGASATMILVAFRATDRHWKGTRRAVRRGSVRIAFQASQCEQRPSSFWDANFTAVRSLGRDSMWAQSKKTNIARTTWLEVTYDMSKHNGFRT